MVKNLSMIKAFKKNRVGVDDHGGHGDAEHGEESGSMSLGDTCSSADNLDRDGYKMNDSAQE